MSARTRAALRSLARPPVRFGRWLGEELPLLVYLAGIGLVSYGAWLLEPAAGFIAGGALLAVSALAYARNEPFVARGEEP